MSGEQDRPSEITDAEFKAWAAFRRESRERSARREHERRIEAEARKQTEALERLTGAVARNPNADALADDPGMARPAGPEWVAIVRAYRAAQVRTGEALPSQAEVAQDWGGRSEDTLKRRLRKLRVRPYHAVHALVASEP